MSYLSNTNTLQTAFILLTLSGLLPGNTMAASITAETLISSCQELIAIYDKKGEQRFLAGMSTSVAEAMRAGICRGMIEEHANHDAFRCSGSWHTIAKNIAQMNTDSSVESILDNACVY